MTANSKQWNRTSNGRRKGSVYGNSSNARRIQHALDNPKCEINLVAQVHGTTEAVTGLTVLGKDKPAPRLQMIHGQKFEDLVLGADGMGLLSLAQSDGLIAPGLCSGTVLNLAKATLADRLRLTRSALISANLGHDAPRLIVKPLLTLWNALGPMRIEPEAMLLPEGERCYRPVEVKALPDLGGWTDAGALTSARNQLAIQCVALQDTYDRLSRSGRLPEVTVPSVGVLVLADPRSAMRPSLHPAEQLEGAVWAIRTLFREMWPKGRDLGLRTGGKPDLAYHKTAYSPACASFCPRHVDCREEARNFGVLAAFSEEMARDLAPLTTQAEVESWQAKVLAKAPIPPEMANAAAVIQSLIDHKVM